MIQTEATGKAMTEKSGECLWLPASDWTAFKTVVTITIESECLMPDHQERHFKNYGDLISDIRHYRKKGWRVRSIETIETDIIEDRHDAPPSDART